MKLCARPSQLRCPLCLAPLAQEEARACERCSTARHEECASELAVECPTPGCDPRRRTRIVVAPRALEAGRSWPSLLVHVVVAVGAGVILYMAAWRSFENALTSASGMTGKVNADITAKINAGG